MRIWYIHLCRDKHIISEWVDSINIPFPYATLTHSYLVIVAFRFCIFLLNVALIFNIALLSTAYIPYANISPAFRFSFLFFKFFILSFSPIHNTEVPVDYTFHLPLTKLPQKIRPLFDFPRYTTLILVALQQLAHATNIPTAH